jgi:hypothetical protein
MLVTEQSSVGDTRWRWGQSPPPMPTIHTCATTVHPCGTNVHPAFRRRPARPVPANTAQQLPPTSARPVEPSAGDVHAAMLDGVRAVQLRGSPPRRYAAGGAPTSGVTRPASSPRGYRRRSVAATWTNTPVSSAISRPRPRGNGPPFILPRMKPSSGSASITSNGALA